MSSGGGTIWALGVCKEELQCELKDQHMDSLSSVVFILGIVYTPSIPLSARIAQIVVPCKIPYIIPFKELRLWLISRCVRHVLNARAPSCARSESPPA